MGRRLGGPNVGTYPRGLDGGGSVVTFKFECYALCASLRLRLGIMQLKEGNRPNDSNGALVLRALRQYTHFQTLLAARQEPEAAWLAYRLLQGYLRPALQG
jgi:hypothetical protein